MIRCQKCLYWRPRPELYFGDCDLTKTVTRNDPRMLEGRRMFVFVPGLQGYMRVSFVTSIDFGCTEGQERKVP